MKEPCFTTDSTDSLGFRLTVELALSDFDLLGQHKTNCDSETNHVPPEAVHRIIIKSGLDPDTLLMVVAHEAYHMFYSVRHLITVDEETEATVFGQLVFRMWNRFKQPRMVQRHTNKRASHE